jgi:hypothetical protein
MPKLKQTQLDALDDFNPGKKQGEGNDGRFDMFFRPEGSPGKVTKYKIRLMPGYEEEEDGTFAGLGDYPLLGAPMHYFGQIGKPDMAGVCPREFGDSCDSCEMFFAIARYLKQNQGDLDQDQEKSLAVLKRRLQASTKTYGNFYVYPDGGVTNPGIYVISMPWGLYKDIKLELDDHKDMDPPVDVTDLQKGRDFELKVTYTGTGKNKRRKYTPSVHDKPTKVPLTPAKVAEGLHDLQACAWITKLDSGKVSARVSKELNSFSEEIQDLITEEIMGS